MYQRSNPPLTVRNYSGGVITRGGLFVGTAGGKLLALDLATGNIGWEGNVATPKGATELERIADVTSLPFVEEQQACAVAYQGRVACFEILRGTLNWSRDLSSLDGLVADSRYLYVTDDRGAVHALDKATGASAWKQDKLAQRRPGGPQLVGAYVARRRCRGLRPSARSQRRQPGGTRRDRRHSGDRAAVPHRVQSPSGNTAPSARS